MNLRKFYLKKLFLIDKMQLFSKIKFIKNKNKLILINQQSLLYFYYDNF